MRRLGAVCVLCAVALVCRAADSVAVNGGTVVEGQVIRDTPGDPLVVINTGGKLLCLNRSEIVSITLDDENRAEYRRRSNAIKDDKAAPHFELYKWAKAQRLYDYADQELSATLKADPRHVEARKIAFAPPTLSKPAPNAAVAAAPAEDTPVIGLRAATPTQHAMSEYDEKVMTWCKALLPSMASDEAARKAALAALTKESSKAAEVAVRFVDPAKGGDEETRLAALAGVEALKPVALEVSNRLALSAMYDPSAAVRKQTISLIKSRNDESAMDSMVKTYIAQFDDESGSVKDPITKKAAEGALRGLEDRRVLGSMLYYATLEVRTQNSELKNFVTRQIDSFTVNNGANVAVVIPLSFPIQFPELKITSVKTTVKAPCSALSDFTGQNFGDDVEKWAKWLRMQNK